MALAVFVWFLLSLLLSGLACACRRREDREETRWLDALKKGAAPEGG